MGSLVLSDTAIVVNSTVCSVVLLDPNVLICISSTPSDSSPRVSLTLCVTYIGPLTPIQHYSNSYSKTWITWLMDIRLSCLEQYWQCSVDAIQLGCCWCVVLWTWCLMSLWGWQFLVLLLWWFLVCMHITSEWSKVGMTFLTYACLMPALTASTPNGRTTVMA